jgi:branched-chain amino acid transport system permease protein
VQRAVDIGPVAIAPKDLYSIALSVLVLVGVAILLQRTRMGKAMRAVADNRDLAASSGINVERVILLVWATGGALAALGGVLHGLGEQVSFQSGFQLLLLMFAGITLGGLGSAYGALVGSFVIGLIVQVGTYWISPELKSVPALAVLIIILLVRPQGILGQAERVG